MKGRVIKAGDKTQASLTTFNPDDALKSLEKKVAKASADIDESRRLAQSEVKQYFDRAIQEGYQQGYQQGSQKAQAEQEAAYAQKLQKEIEERSDPLGHALNNAAAEIAAKPADWVAQWERTAMELICSIAARVVRKSIEHDHEVAGRTLREVLMLVARAPRITIHLNPSDFETLEMTPRLGRDIVGPHADIQFHPDPDIGRGGCRCETDECTIDATIDTQIDRLIAEIAGAGLSKV